MDEDCISAEPIRMVKKYSDITFERFIQEYSKYISEEADKAFSDLVNYIVENYKNDGQYVNLIKTTLKELIDVNLDINIEEKYIDFNDVAETNYRLSILLPIIVKLRSLEYQKAFLLGTMIANNQEADYSLVEEFILAYKTIIENPFTNFYVDLTTYLSDESLERFYGECEMLKLVINALEGKEITINQLDSIDKNIYKLHSRTFEYLKRRFVQRNKILEKR